MGEITMSAKELLYAGAQLGADRFYGIPDPFYPMTQQQLLGEIPRLQSALEKRGLASMGFDGSFTLKEEVRALVGPCAGCRTYLLLDQKSAAGARQMLFYTDGSAVVEVTCSGEDVTLRAVEEEALPERVCSLFWCGGGEQDDKRSAEPDALLRQEDLASARTAAIDAPEDALAALAAKGCGEHMAALLVAGFRQQENFSVLIRADLRRRRLDYAMAVWGTQGAVWMTLEDPEADLWKAEYLPGEVDKAHLAVLCSLKGAAADEML